MEVCLSKGDESKVSIRSRLTVMLFMGILVPILLIGLIRPLYDDNHLTKDFQESFTEFLERNKVHEIIDDIVIDLDQDIRTNNSLLYEVSYLESIDQSLSTIYSRIIVSDQNGIFYGQDIDYKTDNGRDVEVLGLESPVRLYAYESQYYLLNKIIIETGENSPVEIKIIAEFPSGGIVSDGFTYRDFILILVVFLSVYIGLVIWVSRSIHIPLNRLQYATERFSKGDYSIRIYEYTNDKIGDVSRAFDQMCNQADEARRLKEKYEEDRRTMVASISHDLKSPLTSIKVNVSAINDGVAKTYEQRQEAFKIVNNKIDYMQQMIEELFLYSKLDMDTEQFSFREVPLNRFIEDVVDEWDIDDSTKKVEIRFDYDKSLVYLVSLDGEKMRRVIENILGNSLKYAGVNDLVIKIQLVKLENNYQLSISDNGQGVPSSETSNMFDRFYRLDKSRNSETEGSGLGLAIARRIIDHHQGKIFAVSEINAGMTIIIQLPFERSDA